MATLHVLTNIPVLVRHGYRFNSIFNLSKQALSRMFAVDLTFGHLQIEHKQYLTACKSRYSHCAGLMEVNKLQYPFYMADVRNHFNFKCQDRQHKAGLIGHLKISSISKALLILKPYP